MCVALAETFRHPGYDSKLWRASVAESLPGSHVPPVQTHAQICWPERAWGMGYSLPMLERWQIQTVELQVTEELCAADPS